MSGNLPMLARRVPLRTSTTRFEYAHRGLHAVAEGRVENSLAAFEAAIRAGYGIECDVRPSADGTAMVFHDATLDRLTAATGSIQSLTTNELCRLPLLGSRPMATMPTYTDVLATVHGRCPLLVEVKSEWGPVDPDFIHHIAAPANAYVINVSRDRAPDAPDPLMLMSFDPAIVAALARAAPTVPRGLVSGSYYNADGSPWWTDALEAGRRGNLRDLADFHAVGASFIAYEATTLPSPRVAELRAAGNPVFAWTIKSGDGWAATKPFADAAIFETAI